MPEKLLTDRASRIMLRSGAAEARPRRTAGRTLPTGRAGRAGHAGRAALVAPRADCRDGAAGRTDDTRGGSGGNGTKTVRSY